MDKKDRNRTAILTALSKMGVPASAQRLVGYLAAAGHSLSERTVRLYLQRLDQEGLTEARGRRRVITEKGLAELRAVQVLQRVGCLAARIDQMTFDMTFDLNTTRGLVVVNLTILDPKELTSRASQITTVFDRGYSMGQLLAVLEPGERLDDLVVPPGMLGFCTVCSITLNGVLLKHGIPSTSRFGGLLELRDGRPLRFAEVIHYESSTLDPLEVFIRSGMTDCCGAIRDGCGLIGAGFREIPENSRDRAVALAERVSEVGLGGFLEIGWPEQPVLGFPVSPGRVGVVLAGGLNPIAVIQEQGCRLHCRALAGLMEFGRLTHYQQLPRLLGRGVAHSSNMALID
jgi:HTH-type transcriptional regulator, global nitrogen regulator NrpRI